MFLATLSLFRGGVDITRSTTALRWILCLAIALVSHIALAADPIPVASFDFEGDPGQGDPQGWRPLHRFQNETAHYHVDDFSGAGQQVAALAGTQSMWCGLAAEDPRTCSWDIPPGYGSNWSENLTSIAFSVQGDVTLSFLGAVALEPGYDYLFVEYLGASGQWETLDTYSCAYADCIDLQQQYVVPAANHDGSIRFRFYLDSDPYGDAEKQLFTQLVFGFVVDDLTVSDANGTVDFQDFEDEALGDQTSDDGHWYAEPNTDFYHGGILLSGPDVLQESAQTNDTHFWGFIDGSTRDYGCAGHPEQRVVDETRARVRSPRIDLTQDLDGHEIVGDADSVAIEFDVYRDIYYTQQKWYWWNVETYSASCLIDDVASSGTAQGDQKDWYRHRVVFVPDPGTESIEIDLGVENFNFNQTQCRSHSPLLDNVSVTRYGGTATAVADGPARQAALLRQNKPNPFNPTTTIEFEVPAGVGRVSLVIHDATGRTVRTLVDGSLPAGWRTVRWDGRDDGGKAVASGVYFYELQVDDTRAARRMVLLR